MGVVLVKTACIELDGVAITRETPYKRRRSGVGCVPQGREIFGPARRARRPANGPGLQPSIFRDAARVIRRRADHGLASGQPMAIVL